MSDQDYIKMYEDLIQKLTQKVEDLINEKADINSVDSLMNIGNFYLKKAETIREYMEIVIALDKKVQEYKQIDGIEFHLENCGPDYDLFKKALEKAQIRKAE